jgi:hypothetical protein
MIGRCPIVLIKGAPLLWPRVRSRVLRPLVRSSWPLATGDAARAPKTAVEMTRLWKSQNDFHSRLEISHIAPRKRGRGGTS